MHSPPIVAGSPAVCQREAALDWDRQRVGFCIHSKRGWTGSATTCNSNLRHVLSKSNRICSPFTKTALRQHVQLLPCQSDGTDPLVPLLPPQHSRERTSLHARRSPVARTISNIALRRAPFYSVPSAEWLPLRSPTDRAQGVMGHRCEHGVPLDSSDGGPAGGRSDRSRTWTGDVDELSGNTLGRPCAVLPTTWLARMMGTATGNQGLSVCLKVRARTVLWTPPHA